MASKGDEITLSAIKELELLAAATPDAVSLAQGIPSFDTPEPIKRAAKEALDSGRVAAYTLTPGLPELRELIAEHLETQGMHYDFEHEIIITVGAIEALTSTFLTILEPGDEVLLSTPSYVSYNQSIRIAGGRPVYVPLDEASEWSVNIEAFADRITDRTKAVLLCNPNNPTGTIYSEAQLKAIAELCESHNLYIVTDEVYKDFLYESPNGRIFSLAELPELKKLVIRVFSFSKAFAMTGWRIGYLHTDKELAQKILRVHDSLVTCAPAISQYAAIAALRMTDQAWEPYRKEYEERRDLMCRLLGQVSDQLSFVYPKAAYFVFPRMSARLVNMFGGSRDFALTLLKEAGVAVVPGVHFGPSGEDHIRLSFGRTKDSIELGISRLTAFLEQKKV